MRVTLCAVGRARRGPEADLVVDYLARFDRIGRSVSLGPSSVVEVEARGGGGTAAEARLLSAAIPAGAVLTVLDERGVCVSSEAFAGQLNRWAEDGRREAAFVIGGADGLEATLRERADLVLSLGSMVWPHLLVRAMLAEQLYRAASILAGSPYHRGG
jgi:23S rRNA (pseudouridine1915-N3)-methyltransferase